MFDKSSTFNNPRRVFTRLDYCNGFSAITCIYFFRAILAIIIQLTPTILTHSAMPVHQAYPKWEIFDEATKKLEGLISFSLNPGQRRAPYGLRFVSHSFGKTVVFTGYHTLLKPEAGALTIIVSSLKAIENFLLVLSCYQSCLCVLF